MFYHMSAQTLKNSMFSLVLITSVCVYAPMSLIFLLLLLVIFHCSCVAGKCICSSERERESYAYGRERIMHTHKEGGRRGRMNPHTSHADVLRRRYAHYGNSHANGRRTSTENTNVNSSTSTRRRSIRLAAGAGGRGGGGVDARGILYISNIHWRLYCK